MFPRNRATALALRLETVRSLFRMTRRNGRWWLLPLLMTLTCLGFAFVLLEAIPYVAPFVYAIF